MHANNLQPAGGAVRQNVDQAQLRRESVFFEVFGKNVDIQNELTLQLQHLEPNKWNAPEVPVFEKERVEYKAGGWLFGRTSVDELNEQLGTVYNQRDALMSRFRDCVTVVNNMNAERECVRAGLNTLMRITESNDEKLFALVELQDTKTAKVISKNNYLESEMLRLKQAATNSEGELKDSRQVIKALRTQAFKLEKAREEHLKQLEQVQKQATELKKQADDAKRHAESTKGQYVELADKYNRLLEKSKGLSGKYQKLKVDTKDYAFVKSSKELAMSRLETMNTELEETKKALQEKQEAFNTSEATFADYDKKLHDVKKELKDSEEREQRLQQELADVHGQLNQLRESSDSVRSAEFVGDVREDFSLSGLWLAADEPERLKKRIEELENLVSLLRDENLEHRGGAKEPVLASLAYVSDSAQNSFDEIEDVAESVSPVVNPSFEMTRLKEELNKTLTEKDNLEATLQKVRAQLSDTLLASDEKLHQLEAENSVLCTRLESLEEGKDQSQELINTLRKANNSVEALKKQLTEQKEQYEEELRVLAEERDDQLKAKLNADSKLAHAEELHEELREVELEKNELNEKNKHLLGGVMNFTTALIDQLGEEQRDAVVKLFQEHFGELMMDFGSSEETQAS